MPAGSLYRYFQDSRCKIRNQVIPYFPRDLVTMKSGIGFHESCAAVYIKSFRDEMSTVKLRNGRLKYTHDEIAEMLPPQHWEFTKNPWYFGLAVKIFRRDPQLAVDVPNVMKDPANVPVSRAVLRREAQLKARRLNGGMPTVTTADVATPSPPTDSSVVSTPRDNTSMVITGAHHDKLLWAKVMASKAHAETTNIAKRMGKMEELEKGMALLEKMRPVIGEELYANQVRSLFAALPNFKAFDSAVDIIDVDSTVADDEWRTTKRRLSSDDDSRYTAKRNKKNDNTDGNFDDDGIPLYDDNRTSDDDDDENEKNEQDEAADEADDGNDDEDPYVSG